MHQRIWRFSGDFVGIVYDGQIRFSKMERQVLLAFNHFQLDTGLFTLRLNNQLCPIEPQVFDLLVYLIKNRDRIISRQELLDELWSGKVVNDSTLSSCIKASRQAIGDDGKKQQCVATVHRRGYRFVAEVKSLEQSGRTEDNRNSNASILFDRPSIAVLSFAHNHGSNAIAWAAEMLGEDIGIQLARIPGFIVISRNSTSYYREREVEISQIGKDLGADYVIEGSVWETGKELRVSVQLLESNSARLLWAKRTEIPADNLGTFRDDAIYEIVGQIEPALNRAELSTLKQRRNVDLGAWALYRQGHATLSQKGWSEESFAESANFLRQAIARDPKLAFAHAYLSLIIAIGHLVGLVNHKDWREEAEKAAETAIALDNQDSDVLGYVGCAFADMGDLPRGMGLMRRAIELNPGNAQAHAALGAAMLQTGEEAGVEVMRHGMHISPRDNRLAAWGALLARSLLSLGKIEAAIKEADKACRFDDKIFLPRLVLAVAQITAGNTEAARDALDEAKRIRPRLAETDIARFANQHEINQLKYACLI